MNPSFLIIAFLCLFQSLCQVGYQVVNMLRSDGEAYRTRRDALFFQFLFVQLRMRCAGRMYHQTLDVTDIRQKREYPEMVDKTPCLLFPSGYLKSEDTAATIGKQPVV